MGTWGGSGYSVELFGFHSTDFPSEWGLAGFKVYKKVTSGLVSIQLISPASGDWIYWTDLETVVYQFPFN